jgi:hypothetical protein
MERYAASDLATKLHCATNMLSMYLQRRKVHHPAQARRPESAADASVVHVSATLRVASSRPRAFCTRRPTSEEAATHTS